MSLYNIYEVMELGPIVASNQELAILINGTYYNIWHEVSQGLFNNIDVLGHDIDYNEAQLTDIIAKAELIINEIFNNTDIDQ